MMTSAQVVETSVTITNNSPSQDYTHPDITYKLELFNLFTPLKCENHNKYFLPLAY